MPPLDNIEHMEQPFIAAVGVENPNQYRELTREDFDQSLGRVAVGALMSEKTGLIGVANRHGLIYPRFEEMADIMEVAEAHEDKRLPVIVHYNTDHPHFVGEQLQRALSPYRRVEAVQVNGLRPGHLRSLGKLKEARADISLIMQIDGELMRDFGVGGVADIVSRHEDIIDYAWLDGSGGKGKLLDVRALLPYIEAIKERGAVAVGIAGGLDHENVEDVLLSVLEQHPDISWDAQSGVQDMNEGRPRFNTAKAKEFLHASLRLRGQTT